MPATTVPQTLFDKLWQRHVVEQSEDGEALLYVDADDTTLAYLRGRPYAPAEALPHEAQAGAAWDAAVGYWRTLVSDAGARFDREIAVDAATLKPMVTWGTSPDMVVPVGGIVPDPAGEADAVRQIGRASCRERV